MRNRGLMYRLATTGVTMKDSRIPWLVLLTALVPVVLGAFVCMPDRSNYTQFILDKGEMATVLQTIANAQADNLGLGAVFPEPGYTNVAPVCLTQGPEVWTVFDGGVRDEQAMRRLVWDRYPTADHEGNPLADPLVFQPGDSLGYDLVTIELDGKGYVSYSIDLGRLPRRFRVWGDHWYLDVAGNASGEYQVTIQAVSPGRAKAKQVADLIKEVIHES